MPSSHRRSVSIWPSSWFFLTLSRCFLISSRSHWSSISVCFDFDFIRDFLEASLFLILRTRWLARSAGRWLKSSMVGRFVMSSFAGRPRFLDRLAVLLKADAVVWIEKSLSDECGKMKSLRTPRERLGHRWSQEP